MSLESDAAVDRRQLKRKLGFWRLAAILLAVAVVVVGVGRLPAPIFGEDYVALLPVEGVIVADRPRVDALEAVAEDDRAAALVVWINSPGGTTYGSEMLYRALREVAAAKPVVAVMGTVAASGGYMTAIAADYILARASTLTGSIGVLWQAINVVELMDDLGIKSHSIKSAPLKAQPSPLEPLTPEAREATAAVVEDSHRMFVDLVAARRPLAPQDIERATDGRVFTGQMALDLALVDALGGEDEARAWLAEEHGVPRDLPMAEVEIEREQPFFVEVAGLVGKVFLPEELMLDGLISVWQP